MSAHYEGEGRTFATGFGQPVQAPGNGEVLAVLGDRAFPDGFGPGYPVVRVDTGPWGGHEYYVGHVTSLVQPGDRFAFGHPLGLADQGRDHAGTVGGWVELGEAWDGRPGAKTSRPWFEDLIATPMVLHVPAPPLLYGDAGVRVRNFTADLVDCGYLGRAHWRYGPEAHVALARFKRNHNLAAEHGVYDDRVAVVLAHAAELCRRTQRKEV